MVVTGDATTVWDISMVGRQIKAKNFIFTITDVTAVNSLTIDRIWPQATIADAPYTILQAYLTVPNDFRMFYTVIDPRNNWRIWTNYTSRDINITILLVCLLAIRAFLRRSFGLQKTSRPRDRCTSCGHIRR